MGTWFPWRPGTRCPSSLPAPSTPRLPAARRLPRIYSSSLLSARSPDSQNAPPAKQVQLSITKLQRQTSRTTETEQSSGN